MHLNLTVPMIESPSYPHISTTFIKSLHVLHPSTPSITDSGKMMDDESNQLDLLYGESYLNEKNDVNMMTYDLACNEGLICPPPPFPQAWWRN